MDQEAQNCSLAKPFVVQRNSLCSELQALLPVVQVDLCEKTSSFCLKLYCFFYSL